MTRCITVLVVDDEPIARRQIIRLLQGQEDVRVVGECGSGRDALAAIREKSPDLVFLDVQMPGLNGLQVLEQLEPALLPLIVFTTAYDQYAVRAFEIHALDYLLKPFDDDRFYEALTRARAQLAGPKENVVRQLIGLVEELKDELVRQRRPAPARSPDGSADSGFLDRIVVKSAGRIQFVRTAEIDRVKAAGQYVELRAGGKDHLVRLTMDELEARLDPRSFLRIHRSVIVRIESIREIQPWGKSQYLLILQNGEELISSKGYLKSIQKVLGKGAVS